MGLVVPPQGQETETTPRIEDQVLLRQDSVVTREEYLKLLKEKEEYNNRIKVLEQAFSSAGSSASHYSTMKTTIPVPCLERGMTWQDYKFRVELWKQARPVPPESMGWCLINALASDDRCLQQRITDAIGVAALSHKDGADKVVEQLGVLIRNPTFVRLVEWDYAWSNIRQGSKSFDHFVTKVRNLAKESQDEFALELPKGVIAAKLLGGCSQMSPENIGTITQGIDIIKEGQDKQGDVSRTIEEAIRKHISTVRVFADKSSKANHVGYVGRRDVLGIPITPDKSEGDLRDKIRNNSQDNSDTEVYVAGKAGNKSKHDVKRERLKAQGKCYECESTEHLSYDCPKKKARLERRRKEVEAKGEVWRGGKSQYDKTPVNKVNYARHLENTLSIHINEEEMHFSEDEDGDHNTSRTWKSYMTKVIDSDEEPEQAEAKEDLQDNTAIPHLILSDDDDLEEVEEHDIGEEPIKVWEAHMAKATVDINRPAQVLFTATQADHALIDTGCQKSVCGETWYEEYKANLSEEERRMIMENTGTSAYKFGGHGVYKSARLVIAPVYVGGTRKIIKFDVVRTEIPLLLSLKLMQKLNMTIMTRDNEDNMAKVGDTTFKLHYSEGHLYIPLSKASSKASVVSEDEQGNNRFVFLAMGDVFTKGKETEQIRKLHCGAGHAPLHKMRLILREAGQWNDVTRELVAGVLKNCPVKRCRESGEIQKKDPVASIRVIKEIGDIVSVDLKIRHGARDILYAIDGATSYAAASFIENKTSEEVATRLFRTWYGRGLPRIKVCKSDNGSEFIGRAFQAMSRLFNTHNVRTVPYHPASNGQVERVHAVIDGIMDRLLEGHPGLEEESALVWALASYNSATMSTGFTPNQLVFGVTNTDVDIANYDVMDCVESPEDRGYRFMQDFQIRREAKEAHLKVKNCLKLKQVLLRKSNPTPDRKPIGSYVFVRRNKEYIGIGQICHTLGNECAVKMSKGWMTCKHGDLLPLTSSELIKHGLGNEHHEDIRDAQEVQDKDLKEQEDNGIYTELEYFHRTPTVAEYIHPDTHDNGPTSEEDSDSDSVSSRGSSANTSNPPDIQDQWVQLLNNNEVLRADRANNNASDSEAEITDQSSQSSDQDSQASSGSEAEATTETQTEPQQLQEEARVGQGQAAASQEEAPQEVASKDQASGHEKTGARPKRPRRAPATPRSKPVAPTVRSPRSPASPGSQPAPKKSVADLRTERYVPDASTIKLINVIDNPRKKGEQIELFNEQTKTFESCRIVNGSRKPGSRSCYRVKNQNGCSVWKDLHKVAWRETGNDQSQDADIEDEGMDISHVAYVEPGKIHEVYHSAIPYWQHSQPLVLKAKDKEMSSHEKFGTFKETQLDSLSKEERESLLPSTWSIVYKGDPKDAIVKARLCVRGDLEKGIEHIRTDSPTANPESLRLILTFAASTGFKINSIDFSSAFVQGKDIDRTVFLRPPPDIRLQKPGMVWKVIKRLYGFKDASRGWMQALDEELRANGMVRSHFDKGLYLYYEENILKGLMAVHVDDVLFAGPAAMYTKVIKPLKQKYVIGAEDQEAFTFTGWGLVQDSTGITLSQDQYMEKTNLQDYEHFSRYTLSDKELLTDKEQSDYRALNGILGWIAGTSRPQLSYQYSSSSGKLNKATKGDAKHLMRILEKTKAERSILRFSNLGPVQDWKFEIYVDASPGRSKVYDSYTGEVCFLTNDKGVRNVTSWKCQKLDIPSATPLEAEAEALLNAHAKIKNFKYLFNEIFNIDIPADLITDSKSLASSINSDNSASKNRKIAVAVITARKLLEEDGNIKLLWTEGNKNPSDVLTKGTADSRLLVEILQSGKSKLMNKVPV